MKEIIVKDYQLLLNQDRELENYWYLSRNLKVLGKTYYKAIVKQR